MDKRTFFNEMASTWDQKFYTLQLQEHLEKKLVPRFHLRPASRVLDVGGGTGGIIPFLLQALGPKGEVHSIDFAEKMVGIARMKFAREPRVSVQVASVEDLPFEDHFFDHVVCFGVFPHIEDRPRALQEINRVLKVFRDHGHRPCPQQPGNPSAPQRGVTGQPGFPSGRRGVEKNAGR